jgi:putative membrane protein
MGPGMHDSWMYGGFGMWLWPVLVIVLIIALILFFGRGYSARNFHSSDAGTDRSAETPLNVLQKRYAKGEITKDEFDRMKKDILS